MMAAEIPVGADSASNLFVAAHRVADMDGKAALDVMTTVEMTIDADHQGLDRANTGVDLNKSETADATIGKTQHRRQPWNCRSEKPHDRSPSPH
ncbi:MAG: hypothetical protein NT013_15010 [Planctomycetia bacterium]|nr:hypothetical protein [Planctomycetia bacterium]